MRKSRHSAQVQSPSNDNEVDKDRAIAWNGPWELATNKFSGSNYGNYGSPYKNTLHSLSSNGSLSFSFSGNQVGIWGVNQAPPPLGQSWECFVDGMKIPSWPASDSHLNQFLLCTASQLPNGDHTLELVVTFAPGSTSTFYTDFIAYVPSTFDSDTLSGHKVVYRDSYEKIYYSGSAWGAPGHTSGTPRASVGIPFSGTSLTWIGAFPANAPSQRGSAAYSIDGGFQHLPFQIANPVPGSSVIQYNQEIFQVTSLSPGWHTLLSVFLGNESTVPFVFTAVIIDWEEDSPSTSRTRSQGYTTPTTANSHTATGAPGSPAGAAPSRIAINGIIGGTVGTFSVVVAVVVFVLWLRSRRKARKVMVGDLETHKDVQNESTGTQLAQNTPPRPPGGRNVGSAGSSSWGGSGSGSGSRAGVTEASVNPYQRNTPARVPASTSARTRNTTTGLAPDEELEEVKILTPVASGGTYTYYEQVIYRVRRVPVPA